MIETLAFSSLAALIGFFVGRNFLKKKIKTKIDREWDVINCLALKEMKKTARTDYDRLKNNIDQYINWVYSGCFLKLTDEQLEEHRKKNRKMVEDIFMQRRMQVW